MQAENQALETELKLEENDLNFFNILNSKLPMSRILEPYQAKNRSRPSMTPAKSVRELHTPLLLGSNKVSPARSVRKLVPLKDSVKIKAAKASSDWMKKKMSSPLTNIQIENTSLRMLQARARIASRYLKSHRVSAIPDTSLEAYDSSEPINTSAHKDQKGEVQTQSEPVLPT